MTEGPKLTIETRWDMETGIIDQRVFDSNRPLTGEIVSMVIRTKEDQIASALQQLGWTPPPQPRAPPKPRIRDEMLAEIAVHFDMEPNDHNLVALNPLVDRLLDKLITFGHPVWAGGDSWLDCWQKTLGAILQGKQ